MLVILNFAHVLTAAVYITWWGLKVWMEKFAKWWHHTLELYRVLYLQDIQYILSGGALELGLVAVLSSTDPVTFWKFYRCDHDNFQWYGTCMQILKTKMCINYLYLTLFFFLWMFSFYCVYDVLQILNNGKDEKNSKYINKLHNNNNYYLSYLYSHFSHLHQELDYFQQTLSLCYIPFDGGGHIWCRIPSYHCVLNVYNSLHYSANPPPA